MTERIFSRRAAVLGMASFSAGLVFFSGSAAAANSQALENMRLPQKRPEAPGAQSFADGLHQAGVSAPSPHGKSILVNIPSADITGFENGEPIFWAKTIVGARSTPTPIGSFTGGVVRFRPTWTPTSRMVETGKYKKGTVGPGKNNPLGLAALRFAEGGIIYLHGTNRPDLFDRTERYLSSGCVRVSTIEYLAEWALGWSSEKVQAAMDGKRTFDAPVEAIPISLSYHTTFPLVNGRVTLWPDVYRRG